MKNPLARSQFIRGYHIKNDAHYVCDDTVVAVTDSVFIDCTNPIGNGGVFMISEFVDTFDLLRNTFISCAALGTDSNGGNVYSNAVNNIILQCCSLLCEADSSSYYVLTETQSTVDVRFITIHLSRHSKSNVYFYASTTPVSNSNFTCNAIQNQCASFYFMPHSTQESTAKFLHARLNTGRYANLDFNGGRNKNTVWSIHHMNVIECENRDKNYGLFYFMRGDCTMRDTVCIGNVNMHILISTATVHITDCAFSESEFGPIEGVTFGNVEFDSTRNAIHMNLLHTALCQHHSQGRRRRFTLYVYLLSSLIIE